MIKRSMLGLLLMALMLGTLVVLAQEIETPPLPLAENYPPTLSEQQLNDLYNEVVDSVVNINVAGNDAPLGTGTGFVIDSAGYIVTNNHVVESADYIEVTFNDGTTVEAELVGRDPDSDLAVVQADAQDPRLSLQPVEFSSSSDVLVGQGTMAIGSPFGQSFTLTTGIVSAVDRSIQGVEGFSIPEVIQTDAAINPGNSGGPLMNLAGQVIGVNTAILSRTGVGSGVGFAVPSDTVRRIVPYLIADGMYRHSYLGIGGAPISPAVREAMELPPEIDGVMIASIAPGGPADEAGLHGTSEAIQGPFGQFPVNGDIITAINGEQVRSMNDLVAYLENNTLPGDAVTLSIWRDGALQDVTVDLAPRPGLVDSSEEG